MIQPADPIHALPAAKNYAIALAVLAFHALALAALPLWLLPMNAAFALLLLPFFWLFSTQWGLVHEAIHKLFDGTGPRNEFAGRSLSVLMGTSFHVLKFGHLIHHQLNRDWHPEFVQKKTWLSRAGYYWTLLFGLYASELVGSLLIAVLPKNFFLRLAKASFMKSYPEVAVAGERFFYTRDNAAKVRVDVMAAVFLYGAAFYVYGTYWYVLALFMAARALVISFMDNIYHYGTPADNSVAGKELALPHGLSALLLHGNYHGTHHLDPSLPWTALPAAHRQAGRTAHGAFFTHGIAQLRGPIIRSV